eukprot:4589178-Prymnesium_polylepis.1
MPHACAIPTRKHKKGSTPNSASLCAHRTPSIVHCPPPSPPPRPGCSATIYCPLCVCARQATLPPHPPPPVDRRRPSAVHEPPPSPQARPCAACAACAAADDAAATPHDAA